LATTRKTSEKKKPVKRQVPSVKDAKGAKQETEAKRVAALVKNINKAFGANTVLSGETGEHEHIRAISSGNVLFDEMTGCGGMPRGRVTELFGGNSAGKTTLLGHVIAQVHAVGGRVAYLEPENKLLKPFYRRLGVQLDDTDLWHTAQDSVCEVVLPTARTMVESGLFDLVIIDSIARLGVGKNYVEEGEVQTDFTPRSGAGLERAAMLTEHMQDTYVHPRTAYVLTNHVRYSINGKSQPGGSGVKHAAALRLEMKPWWPTSTARKGSEIRCVKNQVGGRSHEWVEMPWAPEHDTGYDAMASYVLLAPDMGLLEKKAGGHYYLRGERICQGWANAIRWFEENPGEFAQLKTRVDEVCEWAR